MTSISVLDEVYLNNTPSLKKSVIIELIKLTFSSEMNFMIEEKAI